MGNIFDASENCLSAFTPPTNSQSVIPDKCSNAARRSGTQHVSASECEHKTIKSLQTIGRTKGAPAVRQMRWVPDLAMQLSLQTVRNDG
ncbi:hypothetical protein, partial [Roseibium sp.]|uniref:hypothetical protein n=1 Tax=Roseibium sp. TaxID=1936156 RepID=UPI003299B998